ncbi:MAG: methylmalonyl-CoA mutase [Deltaproteobacteria bacterium]|nr:methylmalonyl-CoA mutase [Deltaproteobacteria bacterium]
MSNRRPLFDRGALGEVQTAQDLWRRERLEGSPMRGGPYQTASGIPIEPVYTPASVPEMDYVRDLGLPGMDPFVRGVYPTMYRGQLWTVRQLAGFGPAEETNKRLRFLLGEGATGLNCTFDYPTLRGYDTTDPLAAADAGRGGVAIDTVEDMSALFEEIPIDRVSVSLVTCQPICNISIQSMFFADADRRRLPRDSLAGTSQNDFLMETVVTTAPGVLPPDASFRLSCDAIEHCSRWARRWNPVSFSGYNYREAGCTAVQEIAFAFQNAISCTEELLRRGLRVEDFAPRLSFFFSASSDFFEEIAKYRAARRVWSRIMGERYRVQDPRCRILRFHVQTTGAALTAQQPMNNIARAAYHALSAVLGGAQSVHVDGYDEALCTPTEMSSLIALRTQQVLQHETGVTQTADPLGGSYFVEALTNEMEQRILSVMEKIDHLGGLLKTVSSGWIHQEIALAASEHQKGIEDGTRKIVGVNCFQMAEEPAEVPLFEVPEALEVQRKKLDRIRRTRSAAGVQGALDDVARAWDTGGNLMDVLVEAVKVPITEGEVSELIKGRTGIWNPPLF